MSSYDFERSDENTPLIKDNTINSNINYTSKGQEKSNFQDSGSYQNSSCYNNDLTSSDGNNNSNNVEESGAANQKIKIYAKRWYILAVFSVLGILQVKTKSWRYHSLHLYLCKCHMKPFNFQILFIT